ncbi:MAG: PolC-type DNA polymerase III [Oscillospiraceae bacterium]|nr:PolC-type DNA polymerase III [Oscillospiraceae bacterium]
MTEFPSIRELFCDCPFEADDRAGLSAIQVQSVTIDRDKRVMDVLLSDPDGMAEDVLLMRLERQLAVWYALRHVKIATVGRRPEAHRPEARRSEARLSASAPAASSSGVAWGRAPRGDAIPMEQLAGHTGAVVVEGDVFSVNTREAKNGDGAFISFDMTDYTDSVRVARYLKGEELAGIAGLKAGARLRVGGRMEVDARDKTGGVVLRPTGLAPAPRVERADTAPPGRRRVELHLHTRMSALDATTDAAAAVRTAAVWGHAAVAITDHGVLHAFPDALAAQRKYAALGNKIKVIYGCEGYLSAPKAEKEKEKEKSRSNHIILLARNQTGLFNLYKLVSLAHIEHFKGRANIPRALLDEYREGLIVGSACERGELFSAIVAGKSEEECRRIAAYYDYLEIQPLGNNAFMLSNGMARDTEQLKEFNRMVLRIGRALGKPVAATGDVHFLNPEDEIYRRILLAGKQMPDPDRELPLYFKTTGEMLEEFAYLGDEAARVVIDDPHEIAAWCEEISPIRRGEFFPKIDGTAEELRAMSVKRAAHLYGESLPPVLSERMGIELDAIIGKGYDIIYMISQKLVERSLREGYLVGSRGSVGSSVVAFLIGITEVNALPPHYRCPQCKGWAFPETTAACGANLPDKTCPACGTMYGKDGFDIPFATFMGFEGDKTPDVDLNFSGDYQARAHQHAIEFFGEGKVFRAGTIGTLGQKTAIGFVLKYLEERGREASHAEVARLVAGCVGVKRTTGQHPGGLIILPRENEIYEFCPVQHPADKSGDVITTHFDYHAIEENLLKLDLLGHDDPTMIRFLEEKTGAKAQDIPLDDPDTMSLFVSPKALGLSPDPLLGRTGACAIPEFGTKFVREILTATKPKTFDDLVRISGLSHGTDVWLGNAAELIKSGCATLREVICCRDDIMLYLISMGLDRKLAFTVMESVRRGRGLLPDWEAAMRAARVPEWYIESCRKIKYLFPKAHAVAYVLMAFRIAWFKVHRPLEFYAAYFSIRAGSFDATLMTRGENVVMARIKELENLATPTAAQEEEFSTLEVCYEFYKRGFRFLPLDVRVSGPKFFSPEDGALRPPFVSLPGLGETAALDIETQRRAAAFLSVDDLSTRCAKVSRNHVQLLVDVGAFGELPRSAQLSLFDMFL